MWARKAVLLFCAAARASASATAVASASVRATSSVAGSTGVSSSADSTWSSSSITVIGVTWSGTVIYTVFPGSLRRATSHYIIAPTRQSE